MKGQGSGIPKSVVKNWGVSRRVGEARSEWRLSERGKRGLAKGQGGGEERNSRGSLVRLCEIKTRFTGSFYCGYGVSFVSLWTRSTAPFNRFNEYIVLQWSRWEYHVRLFFFLTTIFRFLLFSSFASYLYPFSLIPLAFAQQTKHLKQPFINGTSYFLEIVHRLSSRL